MYPIKFLNAHNRLEDSKNPHNNITIIFNNEHFNHRDEIS
jgi:hypothetical protein